MTKAPLPQFVRDMLVCPPRAGEGVNLWLYRMARVLHPYRTESEIADVLQASTLGCGRFVNEREIERAILRSKATAWQAGSSGAGVGNATLWPKVNHEQREACIAGSGAGLVDLWELSPIRFNDSESHAEEIIDHLFPGNPVLCAGKSSYEFATKPREEWRGLLHQMALIVPSPMTALTGQTQDGQESAHSLQNTGKRRFIIIEFDSGTSDEQAALLLHLAERAPMAMVVHSGSKSLHGWFFCKGQPDDLLLRFMRYAVSLGADRATWTRSQFVRLPDGTRDNGNRQTVFFFSPEVIR